MSRIAYVNGQYVPFRDAGVHIEDRGYQFADGVYEVIALVRGRLVDEARHLDRLERSLGELSIEAPMSRKALHLVMHEVVRRNRTKDGILYLQITRGVARRDHGFPAGVSPSVTMTVRRTKPMAAGAVENGVGIITTPDIRWRRCDIKSISLLPNILAKQQARQSGAYEAWMVDDKGFVTEGASSNAWIVTGEGALVTRNVDQAILNGITRQAVVVLATEAGLSLEERPFTVEEALSAREAFITSTTSYVLPVVSIDGRPVGGGKPGRATLGLRQAYEAAIANGEDA